jgi:hypothetical protein
MDKEFRLDYCDECMQMTNHIDDECQKCKAIENGTSRYNIELEDYGEENE